MRVTRWCAPGATCPTPSDGARWRPASSLAAYGLARRPRFGWMLAGIGALLLRRGMTGHCHTYELFGINTAGTGSDTRRVLGGSGGVNVDESVTIDRPVELLYRFWRNLENLPRFMHHLESVERVTDTLSRWRAEGPGGSRRGVERRDHQRSAEPGDRLAVDRRVRRGQRRLGQFRRRGPTRYARARQAAVQPARGQGRRGGREADRARSRHRDSRRPASVQAAHRKQRGRDSGRATSFDPPERRTRRD